MKNFKLSLVVSLVIVCCCLSMTGCKRAPLFSQKNKFVKIAEKPFDNFTLSYRYNINYLRGFSYWISPSEYVKYNLKDNQYESLGEVVPEKLVAYYSLVTNNPRPKVIDRLLVYLRGLALEALLLIVLLWFISRKKLGNFIVHYFISLPTTIILFSVMLIKILAWFGLDIAAKWAPLLDTRILESYVGFKNGFTPISSWHNLGLYFLATILAAILITPIGFYFEIMENSERANDPASKLNLRYRRGKAINKLQKIAKAVLFVIVVLIILEILMPPFSFWLKKLILLSFGLLIGIENMKYSDIGDKYAMSILSQHKAIQILARDMNLSEWEVRASYKVWKEHEDLNRKK